MDEGELTAIDIEDAGDVPAERWATGRFSDFFLDTYPDCFPDALAGELFDYFRYLVHPLRRCFDTPAKSPRNEEVELAVRNKGTAGSHTFVRDTGRFIVRPLGTWMFGVHGLRRKHYYTSDRRCALLYFDIDCHLDHQTDADALAARTLIERETVAALGVGPLFLKSERGGNGYLKVALGGASPEYANAVFDRLQAAIRGLFAKHGVTADFEVKGTVSWLDAEGRLHAGRYGKLPMCAPDWTYRWHLSLVRARAVTLADLERFVAQAEAQVTAEDVRRHEAERHRAFLAHYLPVPPDLTWKLYRECGNAYEDLLVAHRGRKWIARRRVGEKVASKLWPAYEPESAEAVDDDDDLSIAGDDADEQSFPDRLNTAALGSGVREDADSFARQRKALLALSRRLRRVPTTAEALAHVRDNGLYSGAWANPARRPRVRGILKFVARTFDARKCDRRAADGAAVNVGKYDEWVRRQFPTGVVGRKVTRTVADDGAVVEFHQTVPVGPAFLSVFMSMAEYLLVLDRNDDSTVPHRRAEALWSWLYERGLVAERFDARKWAACRDEMDKYGVIALTDRRYSAGRAMKWAVGPYFPGLGLWKSEKHPSLLGPGSWTDLGEYGVSVTTTRHNSLLHYFWLGIAGPVFPASARPPPGFNTG